MTVPSAVASRGRTWLLAIRPATLPAAVGPVAVGLAVALANGVFRPLPAIACLAVALLLQVAANLANDLLDFRSGADTAERLGPPRVAQQGLLTERALVVATGIVLGLAALVGLYLASVGGPVILLVGAAALVSVLAYTGGPWPYGYHGLGEIFVFVFFGLVAVAGTAYLQIGALGVLAIVAAVPVGALVTAILVVNNLRDIATDRAAGKRTLAVLLGPRATAAEYSLLLGVAFATPVGLVLAGAASAWVFVALLALPLAIPLLREVWAAGDPRRLNPVLGGTARLSLVFALLLAAGIALGGRAAG